MHQVELTADLREKKGKEANKKLKANGMVPAVLYGREKDNISLTINAKELARVIKAGENAIISMTLSDNMQETVILKDWQLHPYKGKILHADFFRISLEESVEIDVPIETVGISPGQKTGGVLEISLREIKIRALPLQILDKFGVDISRLEIGDIIHVKDLQTSEGIEILNDPEQMVITVAAPAEAEVIDPSAQVSTKKEVVKKRKVEKRGDSRGK